MPIYQLAEKMPRIHPESWIAPNAVVIGDVTLAKNASLWWGAVARGDRDTITIGEGCNIQDGSILHTNPGMPLTLGEGVTVGHVVMLHGCTIGAYSLIGIGAIILNNAVIGDESLVAAHTLIPEGKVYPARSLIMGSPGKVIRELTDDEINRQQQSAAHYVKNWQHYQSALIEL